MAPSSSSTCDGPSAEQPPRRLPSACGVATDRRAAAARCAQRPAIRRVVEPARASSSLRRNGSSLRPWPRLGELEPGQPLCARRARRPRRPPPLTPWLAADVDAAARSVRARLDLRPATRRARGRRDRRERRSPAVRIVPARTSHAQTANCAPRAVLSRPGSCSVTAGRREHGAADPRRAGEADSPSAIAAADLRSRCRAGIDVAVAGRARSRSRRASATTVGPAALLRGRRRSRARGSWQLVAVGEGVDEDAERPASQTSAARPQAQRPAPSRAPRARWSSRPDLADQDRRRVSRRPRRGPGGPSSK